MTVILVILIAQGALGAVDTLWHHEMGARLPSQPSARRELALHAAREAIYALIFFALAWTAWRGGWALVMGALLLVEVVITLADFVEEDRTRGLAPSERVLHAVMAIGFGILAGALAPVLTVWSAGPAAIAYTPHGPLSWIASAFGLGVLAWAVRDALAASRPSASAPDPWVRPSGRTVLVTGATGFIGAPLVARLQARGDRVIVLARDLRAARARFGPQVLVVDRLEMIPSETRLDAVVNLAGAPVAAGPWTRARRRVLLGSRLEVTGQVLALIERLELKPEVLVSASAVGFYGDRGDELVDEASAPRSGFMSELCRRWEEEAWLAESWGVRVCRLRIGLVFGRGGGILPLLALPARAGLGAIIGGGQWTPWIHLDDTLTVIERALIDPRWSGPLNLAAPDFVTQADLARAISRALHRPQWLKLPAWPLRRLLGEMSDLILAGQKVAPSRLEALGFRFAWPRLDAALADILGPAAQASVRPAARPLRRATGARRTESV